MYDAALVTFQSSCMLSSNDGQNCTVEKVSYVKDLGHAMMGLGNALQTRSWQRSKLVSQAMRPGAQGCIVELPQPGESLQCHNSTTISDGVQFCSTFGCTWTNAGVHCRLVWQVT